MKTKSNRPPWWPLWVLLATAGCSGDGAGDAVTVRDSAGITIVENEGIGWAEGEGWTVTRDPTVDIGVLEGAAEYQFFRVSDARRLPDGRIVVADANELRYFDAEGVYLFTAGREGKGPGEFQGLGWIRPYPGDSLLAYDIPLVRASLWDLEGRFGRTYRLDVPGEAGFVFGADVFSDGTALVKAPQLFRGAIPNGASKRDETYHTYSNHGEFIDSVGSFPGPDRFIRTGRDGDQTWVALMTPPFGREPTLSVFGERFYFGSAETYEIECRALDGTLQTLVRRTVAPRTVSGDHVARWVDREVADIEDESDRRSRREQYEEMPVPETMPAYAALKTDDLGNLWVREFDPGAEIGRAWTVFDSAGRMLGPVTLPPGFRATHLGDDFVLGVWRDDLDVEHVRLHELIKP